MSDVTLGLEFAGAFVAGALSATLTIYFVGKRIVRKKLGGLLELTSLSAKP